MQSGKYKARPGYQKGYDSPTSMGFLVPPKDIARCVPIPAKAIIDLYKFSEGDNTSAKGEKAVLVVAKLLRYGWFPLPVDPQIIEDADMQITGTDINVHAKFKIQVKCDYKGGEGSGCTGNLFLQTAEINPFSRY